MLLNYMVVVSPASPYCPIFTVPARFALYFFYLHDTPPTEIYTLSLHDALPIWDRPRHGQGQRRQGDSESNTHPIHKRPQIGKHTSELQSPVHLVCRLLLEKKKKIIQTSPFLDFTETNYDSLPTNTLLITTVP